MFKTGAYIFQFFLLASLIHYIQSDFIFLEKPTPDSRSFKSQDSIQQKAFAVLDSKCNFCHMTRKRLDHFTMDNMNGLVSKINEQVFVKNKMPKGKNNVLTLEEKNSLLLWINRESQN